MKRYELGRYEFKHEEDGSVGFYIEVPEGSLLYGVVRGVHVHCTRYYALCGVQAHLPLTKRYFRVVNVGEDVKLYPDWLFVTILHEQEDEGCARLVFEYIAKSARERRGDNG